MLTRHHVELIEIPQRMGSVRKNAADIKMAVDAIELCFERDYITTFVLGTGDSDFTPLVHKLRELNRRVIGIGVEASTSALLPPACDEFLFYERLEGVEPADGRGERRIVRRARSGRAGRRRAMPSSRRNIRRPAPRRPISACSSPRRCRASRAAPGGPVLASMLKRAILRKDPTFSETDLRLPGFLASCCVTSRSAGWSRSTPGPGQGDPEVSFPAEVRRRAGGVRAATIGRRPARRQVGAAAPVGAEDPAAQGRARLQREALRLRRVPAVLQGRAGPGLIEMDWDEAADDYIVPPGTVYRLTWCSVPSWPAV